VRAGLSRPNGLTAGARRDGLRDGPLAGVGPSEGVAPLGPRHLERAHVVALDVQEVPVAQVEGLLVEGALHPLGHEVDLRLGPLAGIGARAVRGLRTELDGKGGRGALHDGGDGAARLVEAVLGQVRRLLHDDLVGLELLEARQQGVDRRGVGGGREGGDELPGLSLLDEPDRLAARGCERDLLRLRLVDGQDRDLLLLALGLRLLLPLDEPDVRKDAGEREEKDARLPEFGELHGPIASATRRRRPAPRRSRAGGRARSRPRSAGPGGSGRGPGSPAPSGGSR
jgi:hypothetical protein